MTLRIRTRTVLFLGLVTAASAALACSFSYSSQSSSDSSKSSSESSSDSSRSSSGSSSPEKQQTARYRQDVADYTEAFVVSEGRDSGFLRGVGDIAAKCGVNDWEADQNTWESIGHGLGRVEVSEVQLEVFKNNWGSGDVARMESIQRGYEAER